MGRLRTVWTAGVVTAGVATLALAPTATAHAAALRPAASVSPKWVTLPDAEVAEQQFFDLLNQARSENALPPLTRVPTLDHYGREWSTFMAGGGCVATDLHGLCHRKDLPLIATAAAPQGWLRAGENVGRVPDGGTVLSLHNAFMASPGHRANILNSLYNGVGVGVDFDANGMLFVTFEFIRTVGAPNSTGTVSGYPEVPAGLSDEEDRKSTRLNSSH